MRTRSPGSTTTPGGRRSTFVTETRVVLVFVTVVGEAGVGGRRVSNCASPPGALGSGGADPRVVPGAALAGGAGVIGGSKIGRAHV